MWTQSCHAWVANESWRSRWKVRQGSLYCWFALAVMPPGWQMSQMRTTQIKKGASWELLALVSLHFGYLLIAVIRLHCSLGVLFANLQIDATSHAMSLPGALPQLRGTEVPRCQRFHKGRGIVWKVMQIWTKSWEAEHLYHPQTWYCIYLYLTIPHYLTLPRPLKVDFVLFSVVRTGEQLRFIDTSLSRCCYGALPGATPSQRTRP